MSGTQLYGDQYEWNADWEKHHDRENLPFIKFEDMKKDIVAVMKRIAQFLNISLPETLMQRIVDDVNIKKMKEDAAIINEPNVKPGGEYVRKGQSGDWKKYFSVEQNERFDEKYKELYAKLKIDVKYE